MEESLNICNNSSSHARRRSPALSPPALSSRFHDLHTVGTNVQVRAVYGNFNEEAGNVNPFKVDLSAAPPHMPSRLWVDGALLQALMLTLWLQHWR